jgi:hypothetical protein
MFQLFDALAARLKALFVTNVALDFEYALAARHAERKVELLRQAGAYEQEGLPEVATELRQRAAELDLRRPLASVLPSLEHWQAHPASEGSALVKPAHKELHSDPHGTNTKRR